MGDKQQVSSLLFPFSFFLFPSLLLFQDDVNEKCKKAIMDTYGKFNTITDPILTYTQVSIYTVSSDSYFLFVDPFLTIHFQIDEFALMLKRDLQPHYEVISKLLAKSGNLDDTGVLLEPRHDRQIFYVFCALMRIRNQKIFHGGRRSILQLIRVNR